LKRGGDFVAADFRAGLGVFGAAGRVGRAQLLAGGLHFDRRLAGDIG
jgi:hypothetical protein